MNLLTQHQLEYKYQKGKSVGSSLALTMSN